MYRCVFENNRITSIKKILTLTNTIFKYSFAIFIFIVNSFGFAICQNVSRTCSCLLHKKKFDEMIRTLVFMYPINK